MTAHTHPEYVTDDECRERHKPNWKRIAVFTGVLAPLTLAFLLGAMMELQKTAVQGRDIDTNAKAITRVETVFEKSLDKIDARLEKMEGQNEREFKELQRLIVLQQP